MSRPIPAQARAKPLAHPLLHPAVRPTLHLLCALPLAWLISAVFDQGLLLG